MGNKSAAPAVADPFFPLYNPRALRLLGFVERASMKTNCSRRDRQTVLRILGLQGLVLLALVVPAYWLERAAGVSVLAGGAIALAVNSWMAWMVFRPRAGSSPQGLVSSLYGGELVKYLFVMAFFALAFKKLAALREPHNALLMIVAFLLVQAVIWLWPWVESRVGPTE